MRKVLPLICLLLFPVMLSAQSTTVSGTVQDAGGQTWNTGTYQFTFVANPLFPSPSQYTWTGGALTTNFSGTLSGTGTYSQSIPSNTSISPPGSTWAIKFCPLATAPCFSIPTITITGGTQTVSPTPPAIIINLLNPQPGSNIVAYAVTEIVGAQVGSQYYLVGTGLQLCSAATGNNCTTWGGASGSGGVGSGAAPVTAFYLSPACPIANTGGCINTFADTQEADDCAWTSGAPDINCNTSHFVPGDCVGGSGCTGSGTSKSAMGGRTCAAFQPQTLFGANPISVAGLPTIASYISATHITLSVNAANTQTVQSSFPNGGCFIWGHPDDSGASALETAYSASPQCPKIELAAGSYMFTQIHFLTQPASCVRQPAGIGDPTPNPSNGVNFGNIYYASGIEIQGRGSGTTLIYLTPNFPNGTNWTNGVNAAAAFVIPVEGRWHDFQITGGYQSNPANWPSNGELINLGGANSLDNFNCTNFGGFSAVASIGMRLTNQSQLYQVVNSGCGTIAYATQPGNVGVTGFKISAENSEFGGISVSQGSATNPAQYDFSCYDCKWLNSQATSVGSQVVLITNFGGRVFLERNILGTGVTVSTGAQIIGYNNKTNATGYLMLKDSTMNFSSRGANGNTDSAITLTTAQPVYVQNSTILSSPGGFDYSDVAGSVFYDEGGNVYTPHFSIAGRMINEANSGNNVAVTAGKLVLSAGWGSTAANTALSGGNAPIQFTITNSGTGQAASPTITYTFPVPWPVIPFSCTATQTGGTNASLNPFTSSSLSVSGVTFTATGTPTASSTEIIQVSCVTQ